MSEQGTGAYLTAQSAGSKLASADYHGAKIMVVRSRCTSLVGLAGIVVRDTKFTFQIITQKDELKSRSFFSQKDTMLTEASDTEEVYDIPI